MQNMHNVPVDKAVDAILGGSLGQPLMRLIDAAAHIARTPGAMLTIRRGNEDIVLGARGIPLGAYLPALPTLAGTDAILGKTQVIADVSLDPLLSAHPLATDGPSWQWVVLVPVVLPGVPPCIMLTCGDPRKEKSRSTDMVERLQRLAAVIADEIELIGEIAILTEQVRSEVAKPQVAEAALMELPFGAPESPTVISDFLLATLIPQRRLLRRGDVPYHALVKWRTSLKAWQIVALRALKRDPPAGLIDRVAGELATAARSLYGTQTFQAVVAVPCGNSGEDCLAGRLAEAVGKKLGVPMVRAFARIEVNGSSHPKRNSRRPAMRIREAPEVPILLIDDVATSGAHIEEAALLLRKTAPAVLPLVWIAD